MNVDVETGLSIVGRGKDRPRSDGQGIRQPSKRGYKGAKGTEVINAASDFG